MGYVYKHYLRKADQQQYIYLYFFYIFNIYFVLKVLIQVKSLEGVHVCLCTCGEETVTKISEGFKGGWKMMQFINMVVIGTFNHIRQD